MPIGEQIVDPILLKTSARAQPLTVFLCGPGIGAVSYHLRERIKKTLERDFQSTVHYGEDLNVTKKLHTSRVDLQTLEAQFAHQVDFTLLMLDSPGAIAELGTFSMIENIRSRLFVILSTQYYQAESYISRGPLSLIASYSPNNIIYYNHSDFDSIRRKLMYPICLYKFAKYTEGRTYDRKAINNFQKKSFLETDYQEYFSPVRSRFIEAATLAAINVLYNATFAELVRRLEFAPDEVNAALGQLFNDGRIEKVRHGTYRAVHGYADPALSAFSSSQLSKRRAQMLAAA